MGLEKAIEHGKEHRKPFKGAKAVAVGCRNHGGGHHNECPWCAGNRQHNNKKKLAKANEELLEVAIKARLPQAKHLWGTEWVCAPFFALNFLRKISPKNFLGFFCG